MRRLLRWLRWLFSRQGILVLLRRRLLLLWLLLLRASLRASALSALRKLWQVLLEWHGRQKGGEKRQFFIIYFPVADFTFGGSGAVSPAPARGLSETNLGLCVFEPRTNVVNQCHCKRG